MYRRFSNFRQLSDALRKRIPDVAPCPPKRVLGAHTPAFLEQRRLELLDWVRVVRSSCSRGSIVPVNPCRPLQHRCAASAPHPLPTALHLLLCVVRALLHCGARTDSVALVHIRCGRAAQSWRLSCTYTCCHAPRADCSRFLAADFDPLPSSFLLPSTPAAAGQGRARLPLRRVPRVPARPGQRASFTRLLTLLLADIAAALLVQHLALHGLPLRFRTSRCSPKTGSCECVACPCTLPPPL